MIDIKISINNGNEAFGTTGKTLTVNEQTKSVSLDFVAEELHHRMPLVPTDVIQQVLTGYAEVVSRLIAEGFCINYTNTKGDVLWQQYVDARLKCQSVNLEKARELTGDRQLEEAELVQRAGEIVQLAGVTLRPYVEVRQKFHELLADYKPKYNVVGVEERAYVEKKDGTGSEQGGTQQGGTTNNPPAGGENEDGE